MMRTSIIGSAPTRRLPLVVAAMFAASLLAPLLAFAHSTEARATHHRARSSPHLVCVAKSSSPQGSHFISPKRSSRKAKRTKAREHGQKAPTPDRIDEIQAVLARGGYYQREPSGKMDSPTQDAMRRFQQANGLNPTGKIDALTLQKLGLGSDTAGVAAPRPAVILAIPPQPSGPSQR